MASNSLRERIIVADKTIVEGISGISTVSRRTPSLSDLESFALTQLPVAAIIGGLPKPITLHKYQRTGQVDQIISALKVEIFVYLQANENADSAISSLMDDMWAALYANPTRSDLCMYTDIDVEEDVNYWYPFAAFKIICNHQYKHTTGGI